MKKTKSLISIILIIVLTAIFGFFILNGFSVGVYDILPIYENLQKGVELGAGHAAVYQLKQPSDASEENISKDIEKIRARLSGYGYSELPIYRQGEDEIRVEYPNANRTGDQDAETISRYAYSTGKVEFLDPDGNVMFEGKDIVTAVVGINQNNQVAINFELNEEAKETFSQVTQSMAEQAAQGSNQSFSVNVDGVMAANPTVTEHITTGTGSIAGSFTVQEAVRLANQINNGTMPFELTQKEFSEIGPVYGEGILNKVFIAVLIVLCVFMVIMIALYKTGGIANALTTIICGFVFLFAISTTDVIYFTPYALGATILSLVIVMISNMYVIENISNEARVGKGLAASIDSGFRKSLKPLVEITILLALISIIMISFGTIEIASFGWTMVHGLISSFIFSNFVLKLILKLFVNVSENSSCTRGLFAKGGDK